MKSLTAAQQHDLLSWQEKLADAKQEIDAALSTANEKIRTYNQVLAEAELWHNPIASAMDEYYDERSETWKEGDAGNEYENWKSAWESADFSTVDEVDTGSIDNPLAELTSEPGG